MPTSDPSDAQIDAHVEAAEEWEDRISGRRSDHDDSHEPEDDEC